MRTSKDKTGFASSSNSSGAQVDLVLERDDQVVDLCEMKDLSNAEIGLGFHDFGFRCHPMRASGKSCARTERTEPETETRSECA